VSRVTIVSLVTFAAFVDLIAYAVAVPVLPDLSRRLGASPTTIGLLFSSFGVTLLLASVPMGAISDRVGRKVPLVAGMAALTASTLLFAYADTFAWLIAARLVQGAADAVAWGVGFALIADLYGPSERGRVMGFVMAGSNAGFMIGPSLGGWLYERGGMELPFLATAALAALATLGFALMPGAKQRTAREHVPLAVVLGGTAVRACVLAVILGASTLAMLEPVVSLWLADAMGLNPARVGLLFGVAAVASVVLHPVYGRLADAWGARRLMLVGLVATGVLLPVLSRAWSFESAVVLYVIQAAAMSLIVTPSLAYMAEAISVVGVSSFGVAYGVYNFSWGVGLLAGPAVGGFLYDTAGFTSLTLLWAPAVIGLTFVIARTTPAVDDGTL
jgi:multidrug resistance protein